MGGEDFGVHKKRGVIVKSLIFYVIFVNKVNPIKLKKMVRIEELLILGSLFFFWLENVLYLCGFIFIKKLKH